MEIQWLTYLAVPSSNPLMTCAQSYKDAENCNIPISVTVYSDHLVLMIGNC